MVKICIDPGHGGTDSGGTGQGRKEKDDVLKIALKIRDLLKAQGVTVVMTRTEDKYISIPDRCALANKEKCDYYLSVHRDAFNDSAANGASIYVYSAASEATVKKAQLVYDAVIGATGYKKRGLKKGAARYNDYGVNRDTDMSSALVELGFISNVADNAIFDKKNDALAKAVASALCTAVGVKYREKTETKSDTGGDVKKMAFYAVQSGAFASKANAQSYADKLKTAGFDAIVKQISD